MMSCAYKSTRAVDQLPSRTGSRATRNTTTTVPAKGQFWSSHVKARGVGRGIDPCPELAPRSMPWLAVAASRAGATPAVGSMAGEGDGFIPHYVPEPQQGRGRGLQRMSERELGVRRTINCPARLVWTNKEGEDGEMVTTVTLLHGGHRRDNRARR